MHMRNTNKKVSTTGVCIGVPRARPWNSKGQSLFAKTNTNPLNSKYGEYAGKNALCLCSSITSQKQNSMVQVSYFWSLTKPYSSLNTHELHLVLPSTRNINLSRGFALGEVVQGAGMPRGGPSALLHLPAHFLQRRLPLAQQLLQTLDLLVPDRLVQVWGGHGESVVPERTFQNRSVLFSSH